jgi:hypothetical protein
MGAQDIYEVLGRGAGDPNRGESILTVVQICEREDKILAPEFFVKNFGLNLAPIGRVVRRGWRAIPPFLCRCRRLDAGAAG